MMQIITPGIRSGQVQIPSSKSQAHRILIAASMTDRNTVVKCRGISDDIAATMACLERFGASFTLKDDTILVSPVGKEPPFSAPEKFPLQEPVTLPCGESGSTLRFMLPLAGVLGCSAEMIMEGRLPERPMEEFEQELIRHGMKIDRKEKKLFCSGQLNPGVYILPGNISSQYFTGLLLALPLAEGESILKWEGELQSADYVAMTEEVLDLFGIHYEKQRDGYRIPGNQQYRIAGPVVTVEGDYSSAAFFLCAGAFSENGITSGNLSASSRQGDRRVLNILQEFGAEVIRGENGICVRKGSLHGIDIDASMIPDLVPVLSVVAAASNGTTRFFHAERLRLKESDRLYSTCRMLQSLGADAQETADGLIIEGKEKLPGGVCVDPCHDHRIAMSAAVAACICNQPVTVSDAECVGKSYPEFWNDFHALYI